jgi:hypothetical protein
MAALSPMIVYVVYRNVGVWKIRRRKRQTDILASEICVLYKTTKAKKR